MSCYSKKENYVRVWVLELVCLVDDPCILSFPQRDYIALWSEGFIVVELMLNNGFSGLSAAMGRPSVQLAVPLVY